MRLAGEHALVTGSTSGIGKAIAVEFGGQGAAVAVHGRNVERGTAVVSQIETAGGTARFFPADIAIEAECEALVNAVHKWAGGLTVLVNNAVGGSLSGVETHDSKVGDMDTAHWENALRMNATAPMWLIRAAIPHMRAAGHGSIINVSSRQAERPSSGLCAYAASKGAMNALSRAVAVEYGAEAIRCNTISPGYVLNERRDADIAPERRERFERMHVTRLGEAGDVAHAAVYLASKESGFLTGINLQLDGGSSIARALTIG
ncbi:MAG: SDR family oxidoreductase [Acidimicrobiia bacterium]|nr:SDR family oxidoreductase [Acidimicrobiia bacterium]